MTASTGWGSALGRAAAAGLLCVAGAAGLGAEPPGYWNARAIRESRVEVCDRISQTSKRDLEAHGRCIYGIQELKGRFTIHDCAKIDRAGSRAAYVECIGALASQQEDDGLCRKHVTNNARLDAVLGKPAVSRCEARAAQ